MTYRLDSDLPDPVGRIVPIKSNHSRSKEHKKLFGSTQSGSISEFVHHEKGIFPTFNTILAIPTICIMTFDLP